MAETVIMRTVWWYQPRGHVFTNAESEDHQSMQSSSGTGNPQISHDNSKFIKNNITTSREIFVMAKKKKKNIQSANPQNKKVTLEKRQAKKDVVLGAEKASQAPESCFLLVRVALFGCLSPYRGGA